MFCCPSRSSSREVIGGSASATRSPPRRRKGCGWAGVPPARVIAHRTAKLIIVESEGGKTVRFIFSFAMPNSARFGCLKGRSSTPAPIRRQVAGRAHRVACAAAIHSPAGALYLMLQKPDLSRRGSSTRSNPILVSTRRSSISRCGMRFQAQLASQRPPSGNSRRTTHRQPSLLAGPAVLMATAIGMTPSHAVNEGHALPLLCLRLADHKGSDR